MITSKEINIEDRPYYLFNDMINIKNFDPNLLSMDQISFKSTDVVIHNIRYITIKNLDHLNIDTVNSLYLVFDNVDGYIECNSIEENNENKYLIFVSTDRNKEALKKYIELWNETKSQIKTIYGGEPIEYKKDFVKIGFESNDDLPLGKILSIPSVIIVTKSVLQEYNKYYPQVFLHECVHEFVSES